MADRFPEYERGVQELIDICNRFDSPELIDDGMSTAPSKRIIQKITIYEGSKPSAAPLIAEKIGLTKIRERCPHFDEWMTRLEGLTKSH